MRSCFSLQSLLPLLWLSIPLTAISRSTLGRPGKSQPLIIDTFQDFDQNDLGFWHGTGEDLETEHEPGVMHLFPSDPDQNFHTQLNSQGCFSLSPWANQFLHVVFEGNREFTVSLNEHNTECNAARLPFPGTADSVQSSRYLLETAQPEKKGVGTHDAKSGSSSTQSMPEPGPQIDDLSQVHDTQHQAHGALRTGRLELYIPLSHFHVNLDRLISVSLNGFYTDEPIALHRIEIVPTVPAPSDENGNFTLPKKLPTGTLVLRCKRPNSFAFGIDDGQPQFAQEVMQILDDEKVRATFFVVASGLRDETTNFTEFYREMLSKGHQVALHSNTHPKLEKLQTLDEIDDEIIQSVETLRDELQIASRYFRPPFGTVGARLRQELAKYINNPTIVNWSVDVEDWLWANSDTPERQLDAFYRGVARGGNLAVMHYLHPSTVTYLRPFIHYVKNQGLQIMRVDQCLEDPTSPPV
ncbi:Peptidoglycan-N-acetylglucosamine deacetylase [Penicillium ucsense]|uniref:Peptidoglycan-N-acetylglucosamine deacetylase n=1 Tax=Penicillium ucsense TaxID=2839758 RepID=A0A8J8W8I0_9EURO|nr:Peptidoglycan-N-acetylglucosamine deacetylase [Penicillium ucsense]KAF7737191.1 Peptidoglycan-N-acetylglucosamine deacetylase [Penicillium ucsense]